MDEMDLIVQVSMTFVAVFLGIPAGFWLERWIDSKRHAEDRRQLLKYLRGNIDKNLGLVKQANDELRKPDAAIFYPLDLQAWPHVSHRLTILNDDELVGKLNYVYYELCHLERKINTQYGWFTQRLLFPPGDQRVVDLDMKIRDFINQAILPHIANIQKSGDELAKLIDEKISG